MDLHATTRYSVLTLLCAASLAAQTHTLVDVESVRAEGDPASFLRQVTVPATPPEIACDVLVVGAGMGGVSAAIAAASRGHAVCMTEETSWIGGQMTAGGVSALDENKFIELTGVTHLYAEMRRRIRDHYRRYTMLTPAAAAMENLNPGGCYVSSLCFEPRVGVRVLEEMLAPYRVKLYLRTQIFNLEIRGGAIRAAHAYNFETREVTRFRPRWVLDATEAGDLLPLAGVPYVVGSEAKNDTNEPHAAAEANPACVQSFTYPFAIEHRPGESHRVAKPPEYERFRDGQPFSFLLNYPEELGWKGRVQYVMFGEEPPIPNNQSPRPFFTWRRLLRAANFAQPGGPRELALINWPRQDYHDESLLDRTPLDTARVLQQAKRVSLAFLHWLQTDLARDDGKGKGYPELMLRPEVMGTADGLSKYPYIRESRRLIAQGRVVEQDIVDEYQTGVRAKWFGDSVGTGFYMVDIHPCGANERGRMMMPKPFQLPMSTLLPKKVTNLLASGKTIGVTHLTNGAFRLHPIEWNAGESAGTIASLALERGRFPEPAEVQQELAMRGVPLVWFDDLPPSHPRFAAIQWAAIRGIYPLNAHDLHASPDAPVTRREAAAALAAFFGHKTGDPVKTAVDEGWMARDHRNWFHPDLPFYWTDCRVPLPPMTLTKTGPVTRGNWPNGCAGL
ncbi:MAG: FAD-dependent oxidoreductase [Bryobacterales bacterium]|nr:FAD-dependent oxidoreductase [Bryobacterales bacterium]